MSLDATIGGSNSNSYSTRAQADAYFNDKFDNELWTSLTDAKKDSLLITASLRIDKECFNGVAVTTTQRLQFPRHVPLNRNNHNYSSTEIPYNLQCAVYEYAYFYLQRKTEGLDNLDLYQAEFIKTEKIGPLTTTYRDNMSKLDELPETVKRELKAIGNSCWLQSDQFNRINRLKL